jgi:hypothetical protein
MDVQTDERLLRNIEGYVSELLCDTSMDELNLLAEVLVSVQDALRDLDQKRSSDLSADGR